MKNKGFTLIEILTVLVILSVLMAIAIPQFVNMRKNTELTTFSNELLEDLRYAKQIGISQGSSVLTINCVLSGGKTGYKITDNNGNIKKQRENPSTVTINPSGTITVTFSSNGSCALSGTTGTIAMTSTGGMTKTITILPATGMINMN